jgi:hypothetical protein
MFLYSALLQESLRFAQKSEFQAFFVCHAHEKGTPCEIHACALLISRYFEVIRQL